MKSSLQEESGLQQPVRSVMSRYQLDDLNSLESDFDVSTGKFDDMGSLQNLSSTADSIIEDDGEEMGSNLEMSVDTVSALSAETAALVESRPTDDDALAAGNDSARLEKAPTVEIPVGLETAQPRAGVDPETITPSTEAAVTSAVADVGPEIASPAADADQVPNADVKPAISFLTEAEPTGASANVPASAPAKAEPEIVAPVAEVEPAITNPIAEVEPKIVAPVAEEEPAITNPIVEVEPKIVAPVAEEEPAITNPIAEVEPMKDLSRTAPVDETHVAGAAPSVPTPLFIQRVPSEADGLDPFREDLHQRTTTGHFDMPIILDECDCVRAGSPLPISQDSPIKRAFNRADGLLNPTPTATDVLEQSHRASDWEGTPLPALPAPLASIPHAPVSTSAQAPDKALDHALDHAPDQVPSDLPAQAAGTPAVKIRASEHSVPSAAPQPESESSGSSSSKPPTGAQAPIPVENERIPPIFSTSSPLSKPGSASGQRESPPPSLAKAKSKLGFSQSMCDLNDHNDAHPLPIQQPLSQGLHGHELPFTIAEKPERVNREEVNTSIQQMVQKMESHPAPADATAATYSQPMRRLQRTSTIKSFMEPKSSIESLVHIPSAASPTAADAFAQGAGSMSSINQALASAVAAADSSANPDAPPSASQGTSPVKSTESPVKGFAVKGRIGVAKLRSLVLGARSIEEEGLMGLDDFETAKKQAQQVAERLQKMKEEQQRQIAEKEAAKKKKQEDDLMREIELAARFGKARSLGFSSFKVGLTRKEYERFRARSPIKPLQAIAQHPAQPQPARASPVSFGIGQSGDHGSDGHGHAPEHEDHSASLGGGHHLHIPNVRPQFARSGTEQRIAATVAASLGTPGDQHASPRGPALTGGESNGTASPRPGMGPAGRTGHVNSHTQSTPTTTATGTPTHAPATKHNKRLSIVRTARKSFDDTSRPDHHNHHHHHHHQHHQHHQQALQQFEQEISALLHELQSDDLIDRRFGWNRKQQNDSKANKTKATTTGLASLGRPSVGASPSSALSAAAAAAAGKVILSTSLDSLSGLIGSRSGGGGGGSAGPSGGSPPAKPGALQRQRSLRNSLHGHKLKQLLRQKSFDANDAANTDAHFIPGFDDVKGSAGSLYDHYSGLIFKDPSTQSAWKDMHFSPARARSQSPIGLGVTRRSLCAGRMLNSYRPWSRPRTPDPFDMLMMGLGHSFDDHDQGGSSSLHAGSSSPGSKKYSMSPSNKKRVTLGDGQSQSQGRGRAGGSASGSVGSGRPHTSPSPLKPAMRKSMDFSTSMDKKRQPLIINIISP